MNAQEVMMSCDITMSPETSIETAILQTMDRGMDADVIPLVDDTGRYCGTVPRAALAQDTHTHKRLADLCCTDALICAPDDPLEQLAHDASSAVPHRTIVVVDDHGLFQGIVPSVHWAVDEAKVQSGHPRSPLEVRTYSMHLVWRCLDCGHLTARQDGTPHTCSVCRGHDFALHTED